MLAEPISSKISPEQYLININAESAWLHKLLTTSGASDIYSDLEEYIDSLYSELVVTCDGGQVTRRQLACWLETRTERIRQKSKELADEQDIRVDFCCVSNVRTSMVFWNAGSMYSTITGNLSQQLESLNVADAPAWLDSLRMHIDRLVASSDDQIAVLENEFKANLDSCTEMLEKLPDQFLSADSRPLLDSIQHSYANRMRVVVLGFTSKIYLDILARTYDYFHNKFHFDSLEQEEIISSADRREHG